MVIFIGPQEARTVVRGLDADLCLKNIQIPSLHRFIIAGVHHQVGKYR